MITSNTMIPERSESIPLLSMLDSSLLPHRPVFNSGLFHVVFVVEELTFGQVVHHAHQVFPVSIILHYSTLKLSLYGSILPIGSVRKNGSVFWAEVSMFTLVISNKLINATKNKNLCTESPENEDDDNLIRNSH